MFRRLPHTLPKDPVIPSDLTALGYFVNDDDQIRQIRNPEQKYQFVVNRNDRVNEVYKETMNAFIRGIVKERINKLGFETLRLPLGATEKDNHVPIWVSPNISSKKRVIVVFGERHNDLGIFSYRVIGDDGIKVGSCLNFVEAIQQGPAATSDEQVPGIIFTNPGQLYWYRVGQRAVSATEWQNLPRDRAVYEAFRVDPVLNRIPGNSDFTEHAHYIFDRVLPKLLSKEVKIDIIGLEWSGTAAIGYMGTRWQQWSSRISSMCLGGPQHKIQELSTNPHIPAAFIDFLSKRCRAYMQSAERLESVVKGREEFGCNCFSSGEELYQENVIVRSWRSMLDWFNLVHTIPDYEEPELIMVEGDEPATSKAGAKAPVRNEAGENVSTAHGA